MEKILLTITAILVLNGCTYANGISSAKDQANYNLEKKESCEELGFEININEYGYVFCEPK